MFFVGGFLQQSKIYIGYCLFDFRVLLRLVAHFGIPELRDDIFIIHFVNVRWLLVVVYFKSFFVKTFKKHSIYKVEFFVEKRMPLDASTRYRFKAYNSSFW